MTSFEGTRAAAQRAAQSAGRVADSIRVGAEDHAQQIRDSRDRSDSIQSDAFRTVQSLKAQTANAAFGNDMEAAASAARAKNAVGELVNNLGTAFVTTATRAMAAQADANIAEEKVRLRQAGSGDALQGRSADTTAPRAYQDAYTESAATVAATESFAQFATHVLPTISDPQEARDSAHKFLAEQTQGMESPAYREYFSKTFLNRGLDAAAKHEANLVHQNRLAVRDSGIAAAQARLGSLTNPAELNDAVETAVLTFPAAERLSARPIVIRALLARAKETGNLDNLMTKMDGLGWSDQFSEAFKGFVHEARAERMATKKAAVKTRIAEFSGDVAQLEEMADSPMPEGYATLGRMQSELESMRAGGNMAVEGFSTLYGRVVKLHEKYIKGAPALASYQAWRDGSGSFIASEHGKYADQEAAGLLRSLADAREAGDGKAFDAARGELRDFVVSAKGYLPKPLVAMAGAVFNGRDPLAITDPARSAAEVKERAISLGIMIDAMTATPSLAYSMQESLSPEQAIFFRMAYDKVQVFRQSPEQALQEIYREFPEDARARIGAFKVDGAYQKLRSKDGVVVGEQISTATEELGIVDSAGRGRFRDMVDDYVRVYSGGSSPEDMPKAVLGKAIKEAMKVFQTASIQMPMADGEGGVSMGSLVVSDPDLRAKMQGGWLGKEAGEEVKGWLGDAQTALADVGLPGDLAISPVINGDGSMTVVMPGALGAHNRIAMDLTDIANAENVMAVNTILKDLRVPVEFVPVLGGSSAELRLRWDSNLLAADRQEAIKQQAAREQKYGGGWIGGVRQRFDDAMKQDAQNYDQFWDPADPQAPIEFFNGFIKIGKPRGARPADPALPEGVIPEQTVVTPLNPEQTVVTPVNPPFNPAADAGVPGFATDGRPVFNPAVGAGAPMPATGPNSDNTVPFKVAPMPATGPNSDNTVPFKAAPMPFQTVGDRAAVHRSDAVQQVVKSAVASLQEVGLVSQSLGLTSPLPTFGSLQETFSYLDKAVEDYQLKQNGGIPVDRNDTPPDQTYRAKRNEFLLGRESDTGSRVYIDTEGHPTVGKGINLDDGGTSAFLTKAGINVQDVIDGRTELSRDTLNILHDRAIASAEQVVSSRIKVALTPNQRIALVSLAYNGGPRMIGPNLTRFVNSKEWTKAEEEIRKYSNLRKHRGLQNRRNLEADTFSSDTHTPGDPYYHS